LVPLIALFFLWGFVNAINAPLMAAMKAALDLSYRQAFLIQVVSFCGYGAAAFIAVFFMQKKGLVSTVSLGLSALALSCIFAAFSVTTGLYFVVLVAVFAMAAAICTLQTAASPLVASLGPKSGSHARLSLAQSFNSLGVVFGANFGATMMLRDSVTDTLATPLTHAQTVHSLDQIGLAFVLLSGLVLIAVLLWYFTVRRLKKSPLSSVISSFVEASNSSVFSALKCRWVVFGGLAIGLYVGAETAIAGLLINFLGRPDIGNMAPQLAGLHLAYIYWGGAMVGRFIGSYLLTRIHASVLLTFCAGVSVLLCLLAVTLTGLVAVWSALFVGLFNSIMFPTIFTLTLEKTTAPIAPTSGLLNAAILIGVLLPLMVGSVADGWGTSTAFAIPMLAYAFILIFAIKSRAPKLGTV
ncbi:MAG: MFS transporter, partial [Kordiimonadaceae bacterium]|nr:MFS transporter [Kordiimonadaceae bacterium]